MIDINSTLDLLKLKFYNEWIYTAHIYDEGDSSFHRDMTTKMVEVYVDPLNIPKDATIIDVGCGPGYFLDEMKKRNYENIVGITLSAGDIRLCESKGHTIKKYDMSFLPQDEYPDESVDFIFLRHALEHSPYPIFTLVEYNRVLKHGGRMYVEVPAPDCERLHEFNLNHYSIFGAKQLEALLIRTGFEINSFNNVEYDINMQAPEQEPKTIREKVYCLVVTKRQPLDIK